MVWSGTYTQECSRTNKMLLSFCLPTANGYMYPYLLPFPFITPSSLSPRSSLRSLPLLSLITKGLLVEFSEALGLYKSMFKYSAVAEISDEIIFCGVRELINKLNTSLLQKLCFELRLIDTQPKEKEYLVNRLLCKLDA